MDRLNVVAPNATLEELTKAMVQNTKLTQQGTDKLGVNLLAAIHSTTSQAVTAVVAAPTKLTDFQSSVPTSGGLIHYSATINAQVNNINGYIQLLVDDAVVMVKSLVSTASVAGEIPFNWFGNLNKGQHTFKMYAYVSGGTMTINSSVESSDAFIVEFLKG